jgi:uncharacterized protein YggE
MEPEKKELHIVPPHKLQKAGVFALAMLGLFLFVLTIGQLKGLEYIGSGVPASNTIAVSGEGEVFAVPDTAEFSYSVQDTEKDVQTAQATVAKKGNDILAYLKAQGVDDKDVQTTDYSVYPQYDYVQSACPVSSDGSTYCPPGGRQVLRGYQASETVTVKVHDTTKAGDLLSGVGGKGATNISGLSFTVADEKGLEAQARGKAIDDARTKAQTLASQLGVSLVRIVGFSEGGGGPIYYAKAMSADVGMGGAAPAPQIATGQNKITSNVSVTYEIR